MPHVIFNAIKNNDIAQVIELLDKNPKLVHKEDGDDSRPLHYAASRGNLELARLLLERGADVNGENSGWEWRPIVYAAWNDHLPMVELLIEAGADVTLNGGQPIHYAGQRRHKEICRVLIEAGAIDDLIPAGHGDILALFRAAYAYDHETVRKLLAEDPDLAEARDNEQRTALHEAATGGAVEVIQVLLDGGVDVDAKSEDGSTAIQRAAGHSHWDVCRQLVAAGATVDIETACMAGMADKVRELLTENPKLAKTKRDGHPLMEAVCEAGWVEVGRVLAEHGAPVDVFTAASLGLLDQVKEVVEAKPKKLRALRRLYNYTPLHCAAECGQVEVVRYLLDKGADVHADNAWRFKPLHFAVIAAREQDLTEDHYRIIELLIENGADPAVADEYERTALDLALGNIQYGRKHGRPLEVHDRILDLISEKLAAAD